jgi:uncharacterized membrane protein YoaK (UPF0700 family)
MEVEGRRRTAVVLAGVAGFVDAVGFLTLDLFSAHMSGNTARLGGYLGHGVFLRAAPSAFAIFLFILSIAGGGLAMEWAWRTGRRGAASLVIGIETGLLVVLAVVGSVVGLNAKDADSNPAIYYPLAALAVAAMGLQTSALQRISGRTVRTTFVSGMLTSMTDELVGWFLRRDRPRMREVGGDEGFLVEELGVRQGSPATARIRLIGAIWFSYVCGAILGGYLQNSWRLAALGLPAAVLAAVIVYDVSSPVEDPIVVD